MSFTAMFVLCALGGYILGSIPFGLVLSKLAGYGDIRKSGSGNIGATNVLRVTGSKPLALVTILLDAFKAAIAAFIALKTVPNELCFIFSWPATTALLGCLIAGSCGVIGHMFPVWLKFKGGKGVSSAFGLLLVTYWPIALIALFIWITMAFIFRYSSLSALTAAISIPFLSFFMLPQVYTLFYTIIVALVIFKHRSNIIRLLKGEETKIKFKKSAHSKKASGHNKKQSKTQKKK